MTQLLGWTATILFTFAYIPQVVKTLRTKTIDGVSIALFGIQLMANIVALAYALRLNQMPLEVKYILGIIFVSLTLIVCSRYQR